MAGKRNNIIFITAVIAAAIVIAAVCRTLWVEFYKVAPSQMESTLLPGDRILVEKWSYGTRLPQVVSLPWIDTIPGTATPAYFPHRPLPYHRLHTTVATRNDIVVYNCPAVTRQPVSHLPTAIARCIGVPGDTVTYRDGLLYVNNHPMAQSPYVTNAYRVDPAATDTIAAIARRVLGKEITGINVANLQVLYINRFEYDRIASYLPHSAAISPLVLSRDNYHIELPPYGSEATVTPTNAAFYAQIINRYEPAKVTLRGNKLYRGGRAISTYTFSQPYYWVIGDNRTTTTDSRYIGVVPHSHLIGKCTTVIYSLTPGKGITAWRTGRFFQNVAP